MKYRTLEQGPRCLTWTEVNMHRILESRTHCVHGLPVEEHCDWCMDMEDYGDDIWTEAPKRMV